MISPLRTLLLLLPSHTVLYPHPHPGIPTTPPPSHHRSRLTLSNLHSSLWSHSSRLFPLKKHPVKQDFQVYVSSLCWETRFSIYLRSQFSLCVQIVKWKNFKRNIWPFSGVITFGDICTGFQREDGSPRLRASSPARLISPKWQGRKVNNRKCLLSVLDRFLHIVLWRGFIRLFKISEQRM